MRRFKLAFLSLLLILGASTMANAQILYKVEKPGSGKTSYILGTHHFAPLSVVDSIAELPEILKGVDKMYGEIDMALMNDPSVMMGMQQKMLAPADSTLDKVLTADQLARLSALVNSYAGQEVPLQMMYGFKPALVTSQLAQLMCMKALPALDLTQQLDNVMQTRAREAGKPVAGLETIDFQLDMLYGEPIAKQAADLMKIVDDPAKEEEQAIKLSNAYLNHDLQGILDLMLDADADDLAEHERLIFSRNATWLARFLEEMPAESMFVVVGAGHLPGDRGVLEGLRKAGYEVTPVR